MIDSATVRLQRCLDRLKEGEAGARDELLQAAAQRFEGLTRRMLRDYRGVKRWEETGDVMQNALVRLWKALETVVPPTARDFYRLATVQIRRELIDLARHYYGPQGAGAHHASNVAATPEASAVSPLYEAADVSLDPSRLSLWAEFHRQAEALGEEEREVFDLIFYPGLPQAEAASLLGTSERTIKRRWQAARLQLHEALGGELPGL